MQMLAVELDINGYKLIIPHAITIEMEEIVGLPFAEARRLIDEKVKRWAAETVKVTWASDSSPASTREREMVMA